MNKLKVERLKKIKSMLTTAADFKSLRETLTTEEVIELMDFLKTLVQTEKIEWLTSEERNFLNTNPETKIQEFKQFGFFFRKFDKKGELDKEHFKRIKELVCRELTRALRILKTINIQDVNVMPAVVAVPKPQLEIGD